MQRQLGAVHVQHQFARGRARAPAGDELIEQHALQGPGLRRGGCRLQTAERGRAGQRLIAPHGRLHGQVRTQRVVVADIGPALAQPIHPLCQPAGQAVAHLATLALIAQRSRGRGAQAQMLVHAPQQQNAGLAAQIAAVEIHLDDASAEPSKVQLLVRTLWHRQSSVGIGGQIPMATRLGTRLPTLLRERSGLDVLPLDRLHWHEVHTWATNVAQSTAVMQRSKARMDSSKTLNAPGIFAIGCRSCLKSSVKRRISLLMIARPRGVRRMR